MFSISSFLAWTLEPAPDFTLIMLFLMVVLGFGVVRRDTRRTFGGLVGSL